MKTRTQIVTLLIVFILSILTPALLWMRDFNFSFQNKIDSNVLSQFATFESLIISVWSLVVNIILVFIAYKAFQNFDVKKQFHSKQLDVVSELSSEISSLELSNMMYKISTDPNGVEHQIATGYTLPFYVISLAFDYSDFDMIVVRTNNIENTFPFLKYKDHPLLPKSISEALKELYRPLHYSSRINHDKLPKNYIRIDPVVTKKDDYSTDWIYEFYNTPSDFNKHCKNLRESIVTWFKKYGADDLNI